MSRAWQITLHIWLVPRHELPALPALHSAFFKQAILSPHKCFGGNHREALIPFPKITSDRGKGQRGGACRPFCKSFKYPGTDPIKRIMKGKQPSLSLVISLVFSLSLSLSHRHRQTHTHTYTNFFVYKKETKASQKVINRCWLLGKKFHFANLIPKKKN